MQDTTPSKVSLSTFIGGILMIIGTAIGGGMLALPVVTAQGGFVFSAAFLFCSWFLTTAGALLLLEVNLLLPEGSNLISMAETTLGVWGKYVAWGSYLFLLYSLLSAYVGGGGEIVSHLFSFFHIQISFFAGTILFVFIFACVLVRGITAVDKANRLIMTLKLGAYFFILLFTLFNIKLSNFTLGHPRSLVMAITTMMTSFGFSIIIPSLRTYFKSDVKKLRQAILLGSFVPLLFYLLWEFALFGVVPLEGPHGLNQLSTSAQPVTELMNALTSSIHHNGILIAANLFTTVCVFTAFLGVSMSLIDFLADGLKLKKGELKFNLIYVLTFIPPIICVVFIPSAFKFGLSFAGIFCMILLTILPAMMAWSGRFKKNLQGEYRVMGGKPMMASVIFFSLIVVGIGIVQLF